MIRNFIFDMGSHDNQLAAVMAYSIGTHHLAGNIVQHIQQYNNS